VKQSVYLSAPGLICCAGQNKNELYESCLNGYQGGMSLFEIPDSSMKFPTGQIPWEMPKVAFPELTDPIAYAGETRIIRIINAALEQLRPEIEKAISSYGTEKIGVCLGSCDNGSESTLMFHRALLKNGTFPQDYALRFQSASYPAEFISRKFGLSGPVFTVATACSSGASAIVRGAELIRAGVCNAVIAGGADVVSAAAMAGFYSLEALSNSLCNPFSKNRKGINLGEGTAFFLLDTAENSPVELLGTGESADAFHMTAPNEIGQAKAINAALLDAEVNPEQIGYVNLHGTGTILNDKTESMAMKMVFGDALPLTSSTKPITGHTQGAAGALETAICWMVLTEKKGLPVHCWDGVRDDEILLLPGESLQNIPSICMSNSFAFGGCNVSLILGRK